MNRHVLGAVRVERSTRFTRGGVKCARFQISWDGANEDVDFFQNIVAFQVHNLHRHDAACVMRAPRFASLELGGERTNAIGRLDRTNERDWTDRNE